MSGSYKDGGSIRHNTPKGVVFTDNRIGRKLRGVLRWGVKLKDSHAGYHGYKMGKCLTAAEIKTFYA